MVELFNCRSGNSGSYMSPSDTGNWVHIDDYDELRIRVKRAVARLIEGRDGSYRCAEDELCGIACGVDDSLGILTEGVEEG